MVENKLILYYKDDIEGEKAFNGIVITEYNYNDDLMGKTQLSGSFMYPNTSLLELFDKKQYTYFRDNKFYLINPPSLSKEYGTDNGMTKYNCVFTSEKDLLDNIPFTDLVPANDSTRYFTASRDFKFYGDIAEFGHRLYANLSENTDIPYVINIKGVIMDGSVGSITSLRYAIQTKFAEFTFSYTSVFAALNLMYENFKDDNLIWYLKNIDYSGVIKPTIFITNTVSNIGDFKSPTHPHIFQYGQGKGLEKISVEPTNSDILTRISGHGSTQNIPFDYPIIYNGNTKVNHPYKRNYLMPNIFIEKLNLKYNSFYPNYDPNTIIIDYYDADDETYPNNINPDFPLINKEPIEFDIKPSIEGIIVGGNHIDQVKSVITTDFTETYDENTGDYDQSTFQIKLHPLGFDLYGHANEKEEMTINMTSGKCVGCAFKVNVDENWLPSYDKKLFRCITNRASGVYNTNDWFPFFNGENLNAVGWWDMMQIVNYYTNPQQPMSYVSPSMALSLSNIWINHFRPLRNYYDLIAQSVYGTNYQNKYLVSDYEAPYTKKPIQDYIDAIMTTLRTNGLNHQNTRTSFMFDLKYLLSDKNETMTNKPYNDNGEIAGYKKAILDLEYYFLRNPISVGSYETIISTTTHPTPTTPYGIGDLWVSSLRVSNDSNYPDSTDESIDITLEKDINTFGTMLPTNNISIEVGDTFVITGINLPQSYVDDAQNKLDIALKERLLADNVDKLNYSIPFDEKFIVENPTLRTDYLMCGNVISFKINSDTITRTIKQLSIEVNDNNPLPKYTCSVSDEFKLRSPRPIIDANGDRFFRRLDDTMITLENRINDIGNTANIGANRFVPYKLYELGDTLDVIGEKTEGLKVFGEVGSIEALSTTAKNVADSKNKCWTIKPIPPYYAGDQWLVSNTDADANFLEGDTLFCKTTRLTNSFVPTDWSKTKYTRDIDFDDVIGDRPSGKKVFGNTDSLSKDISTTNSRFGTLPKDADNNERTVSDLIGNVPIGQKVIEITNSLSNRVQASEGRIGNLPLDEYGNERDIGSIIGNTAPTKTIFGERDSMEYLISFIADKLNNKKPLPLSGVINGSNKVFETSEIFHMGFGDLYLNGVKQFRGLDYEENSSKQIKFLGEPPKTGDVIVFEATENTDSAVIVFKDVVVKDILGVRTYNSVSLINSLGGYFTNKNNIVTFSELQYFVGLRVINASAFQSCSSLETINMPNSIHTIEDSAFQGCSNLQNVIIPKSVKSIGNYSFSECGSITSITIPYSVRNIGSNCFKDCINLTSVIVESLTPPTLGEQCFFNDDKLETIYVPESSVTSYKDAVGWIDYKDIIKPIEY